MRKLEIWAVILDDTKYFLSNISCDDDVMTMIFIEGLYVCAEIFIRCVEFTWHMIYGMKLIY